VKGDIKARIDIQTFFREVIQKPEKRQNPENLFR
jgi:hypothetical protein